MLKIIEKDNELYFNVFVIPKSSQNKVIGIYLDALKIKIMAAPQDGLANDMIIKFLSKLLDIPKSSIEIISGHTNKNKKICITCNNKEKISLVKNRLNLIN